MQQIQKTTYKKCFIGLTGTTWIAGLLIAGSDSPYMPWLNILGLIVFFLSTILLEKLLKPSHSGSGMVMQPKFYRKPDTATMESGKRNRRINTGYAVGV
ncbi:MAG: hypothetical protein GXP56_05695 [Deltaproteobacteria bacterium]|nr:hypothetical protein [Deltaproteobacteria bacterium]